MELLRIPSYQTDAVIDVSSASAEFTYTIIDTSDNSVSTGEVTSTAESTVTIPLPSAYDGSYIVSVDDGNHYVDVVRPYVDSTTKTGNPSEIEDHKKHEELARAIIDSVIIQGFYYKKHLLEITGMGSDYIPLWMDAKKVLKLYENNVLMYDSEDPDSYNTCYEITKDKTAIIESQDTAINRLEGAPIILPAASSDASGAKYSYRGFPRSFDYQILLAVGYPTVPKDIVRATELLIDDISCGKLQYTERYMKSYQTDQFKIAFDDKVFEGTGNFIVDKILSKYAKAMPKLGVL